MNYYNEFYNFMHLALKSRFCDVQYNNMCFMQISFIFCLRNTMNSGGKNHPAARVRPEKYFNPDWLSGLFWTVLLCNLFKTFLSLNGSFCKSIHQEYEA